MTHPTIVVVSPHADDAVFSCAEHMLDRPDARFVIMGVMRGKPPVGDPRLEMWRRLELEHLTICKQLDAEPIEGPFADDVYGRKRQGDITSWVVQFMPPTVNEIWMPMGLRHPDHIQTRRACDVLVSQERFADVLVYEELPYRVEAPELVDVPRRAELVSVGPSYLERKQLLCRGYESQIAADPNLERSIYAPERLWRIR